TLTVRRIIYRYAKAAKIQKQYGTDKNGHPLFRVHPHTLRHSHIVYSIMRGGRLYAIQQQVGHASSLTTDIYAKLAPEEVREAYDRAG
ncbi:MAG: site-specific integrase, partial [Deinococcus sp.]|nr:site-specific integrase [Deinococcus sp.]